MHCRHRLPHPKTAHSKSPAPVTPHTAHADSEQTRGNRHPEPNGPALTAALSSDTRPAPAPTAHSSPPAASAEPHAPHAETVAPPAGTTPACRPLSCCKNQQPNRLHRAATRTAAAPAAEPHRPRSGQTAAVRVSSSRKAPSNSPKHRSNISAVAARRPKYTSSKCPAVVRYASRCCSRRQTLRT